MGNKKIKLGKDLQVGDVVWFSPHMGGTVRERINPDGRIGKEKVIMMDGWGYGRSGEVFDKHLSPIDPEKEYHI